MTEKRRGNDNYDYNVIPSKEGIQGKCHPRENGDPGKMSSPRRYFIPDGCIIENYGVIHEEKRRSK
ncbi:MAG: hypothetical protein SFT93_05920 [Rickettsiaceae bacterium]|nr:hypothetical protein [Rickettsiaceae bacterium]